MEDEVEDMVGDVTYTDSQKSVALEMYSYEQTESVSTDKNMSSGRETYVLEIDDSDESELLQAEPICAEPAGLKKPHFNRSIKSKQMFEKANNTKSSKIVQETFTQTSKTIIQIAQAQGFTKATRVSTLETQTSCICFAHNKAVENREHCAVAGTNNETGDSVTNNKNKNQNSVICNFFNNSLDDESSKFAVTESENERTLYFSDMTSSEVNRTSDADNSVPPLSITEVDDEDSLSYEESPKCESEFEQDSLLEPKTPNIIKDDRSDTSEVSLCTRDHDVEELYNKLTENNGLPLDDPDTIDKRMNIFANATLSPLTEEDAEQKRNSIIDITPQAPQIQPAVSTNNDVLFTNNFGMKVKLMPEEKQPSQAEPFRLPPIQKHISCPNSPHLNMMFTMKAIKQPLGMDILPCIYQAPNDKLERWNAATKHDPASGENAQISERSDFSRTVDGSSHLPPINLADLPYPIPYHLQQPPYSGRSNKSSLSANVPRTPISINKKIRELKNSSNRIPVWRTALSPTGRAESPSSLRSTADSEAAERACDVLCMDLLRRMKSSKWTDRLESLEDLPNVLEKYWTAISDARIAELIRHICSLVESPRTQVAKVACTTLSVLLQNTKYTKKPDFYEAVSILLVKTGSFCRPVRRAANVALDRVACAADLAHTVTALCLHGIDHRNPLVRCAAARLLVVSVALSAGRGRELLRCRPALAATARRHALQALARLLEDKNQDTRKYAERLYGLLRPLANFEAFYLTDVSLETASAQMKKHDRLLLSARAGHESR